MVTASSLLLNLQNRMGCPTLSLHAFVICFRSWWPWSTFTVRTLCTVTSNRRMSCWVLTQTSPKWSSVTLALLESLVRSHFDAQWLAHLPILVSCVEKTTKFIQFYSLCFTLSSGIPFFTLLVPNICKMCLKMVCLTEFDSTVAKFIHFYSLFSLSHLVCVPFFTLFAPDIHNMCFKMIYLTELSYVSVVKMFLAYVICGWKGCPY